MAPVEIRLERLDENSGGLLEFSVRGEEDPVASRQWLRYGLAIEIGGHDRHDVLVGANGAVQLLGADIRSERGGRYHEDEGVRGFNRRAELLEPLRARRDPLQVQPDVEPPLAQGSLKPGHEFAVRTRVRNEHVV